jgi:RNA polymerase sigma-70 factor, ECF subfamily
MNGKKLHIRPNTFRFPMVCSIEKSMAAHKSFGGSLTGPTEQRLVEMAHGGDRNSLAELLTRYRDQVFGLTSRILSNREDALEATQETLLRVYRHIASVDPDRPFLPWLRAIAVRAALDRASRNPPPSLLASEPVEALRSHAPDPHQQASQAQFRLAVERALGTLSPAQRTAFVCKEIEGMDTKETAQAMGCARATVRYHLFEARKSLSGLLADFQRGGS